MGTTVVPEAPELPALDGEVLASLDQQIEETESRRASLEQTYRESRTTLTEHLKRLKEVRRTVARQAKGRTATRSRGPLDPAKQAGPKNIARVRAAAAALGSATQKALADESGVGTGSMTWAIRALVDEGVLEPTGKSINGSREYRYVEKRGTVVPPSDG